MCTTTSIRHKETVNNKDICRTKTLQYSVQQPTFEINQPQNNFHTEVPFYQQLNSNHLSQDAQFNTQYPTHQIKSTNTQLTKDYISAHKPNGDITTAFFYQEEELVIKTDNPAKIEYLKTWPDDAFEHGLIEETKKNKFYLALHTNFNIESA
ncbi:hypothetical protein BpHYR1_048229 [Brachionus plicatilis]|uniref:Uncharacterized protein n=1 Tax=Brachionus plicatilis TaxID=10195 RepID=A0A3M7QFB8_BRAPC|nr:hypothetical protein BpHYR1_048229 [Brachionus plicatilis]